MTRKVDQTAAPAAPSARQRFTDAVKAAGGSKVAAARLGCSRSFTDMIINAQRSPGMRVAFRILQEFGIPMEAWVADEPQRSGGGG